MSGASKRRCALAHVCNSSSPVKTRSPERIRSRSLVSTVPMRSFIVVAFCRREALEAGRASACSCWIGFASSLGLGPAPTRIRVYDDRLVIGVIEQQMISGEVDAVAGVLQRSLHDVC